MLEEVLSGDWSPTYAPWESRKDAILDLLGKAVPGAFMPALQIDPTYGRLLIEALSGRWSFGKDRRDTRKIWNHVADAFSCIVDRISQTPSPDRKRR
jgi:hypothetical protein